MDVLQSHKRSLSMGNIPTNANEIIKKHAVVGLESYKDLDDTVGDLFQNYNGIY